MTTKPTEKVHCRLCNVEMPVNGLLYYCKEVNCDTFPVCDTCLCHECGRCELCCCCPPEEKYTGGTLYCFTCGSVEYHLLTTDTLEAVCKKCATTFGKEMPIADISVDKLYSDGVNFEFLVWLEKHGLTWPDEDDYSEDKRIDKDEGE